MIGEQKKRTEKEWPTRPRHRDLEEDLVNSRGFALAMNVKQTTIPIDSLIG